ncbi:MAG: stage 0 sporulation family protein [Chloroflexi bacterium]|nr:stage 0 sporulation family protein [Chloroflexota bacterium]
MDKVIGVRLRKATEIQYFDAAGLDLTVDDYVIVETEHGQELAQVVTAPGAVAGDTTMEQLKPVVRKAEPEDLQRSQELDLKEKEVLLECAKVVSRMNLPMRLLSAEYDFAGKRLTIYFRAADRVDFRNLVRELAGQLKVRVELRQTRPRDEARMLGGCGRCGRSLCCSAFLPGFVPVSIKMAKTQNLPLNPMKISGVCGRLMCCLAFESDYYQMMKDKLPRDGQRVAIPAGEGRIIGSNPLKETVMVELDETRVTVEVPLADIGGGKPEPPSDSSFSPLKPATNEE